MPEIVDNLYTLERDHGYDGYDTIAVCTTGEQAETFIAQDPHPETLRLRRWKANALGESHIVYDSRTSR